jgi:hypothetical protein
MVLFVFPSLVRRKRRLCEGVDGSGSDYHQKSHYKLQRPTSDPTIHTIAGSTNFCPIHLRLESLALREGQADRSMRMTLSLAFLAPDIVKAAIEGGLPRGYGFEVSRCLPMP